MNRNRLLKGQMMVEVVVAFTVAVIALIGVLQLSRRSVNSAGVANRTALATAYADAGISWVSNERNLLGWSGLREKCLPGELGNVCGPTVYCLGTLTWPAVGCLDNNIPGTEFDRSLTLSISLATPDTLKAVVTVSWWESSRISTITRVFEYLEI